jgi:hypothetical protein
MYARPLATASTMKRSPSKFRRLFENGYQAGVFDYVKCCCERLRWLINSTSH